MRNTNPFVLLDLPVQFELDQNLLSEHYLALQKKFHPDNFVHCSVQEQRLAMQQSAEINDALQLLKDPISRAEQIIQINTGILQNPEEKRTQDMDFLLQQLSLREQLESIEQAQEIDQLLDFAQQVELDKKAILTQLSTALSNKDWPYAQLLTDRLRFIRRLSADIERLEEQFTEF